MVFSSKRPSNMVCTTDILPSGWSFCDDVLAACVSLVWHMKVSSLAKVLRMISFPRSALRWDALPERGMWYLPALSLPFSLAPMTSFVWQQSQKATSICAALTAVCPPVSRLLPMSNSRENPSHTCHQTHTFTNSPSFPLPLQSTQFLRIYPQPP